MTPARLAALRAIRDGGDVHRGDLEWLKHGAFIDVQHRLTERGAKALAEDDNDQRGLE